MTTETIDPFPTAAPRKRRRRAPATGAADDCFTCSNLQVKCDRRRPYCSQCLDNGKECSGYKTTLTWGVGVASRGKLRGLSLPIPGNKKANSSQSQKKPNTQPDNDRHSPNQFLKSSRRDAPNSGVHNPAPTSSSFSFIPPEPTSMQSIAPAPIWQTDVPTTQSLSPSYPNANPHSLQPLHVPIPSPYQETAGPPSANSIGAHGENEFASPVV